MRSKPSKTIVLSYRDTSERHAHLLSLANATGMKLSELLRLATSEFITRTKIIGDKQ